MQPADMKFARVSFINYVEQIKLKAVINRDFKILQCIFNRDLPELWECRNVAERKNIGLTSNLVVIRKQEMHSDKIHIDDSWWFNDLHIVSFA